MIAANRFALNHMNPTNFKITGLIAKTISAFWRRGPVSQSVIKYAIVVIFVVGVLGCQRIKDRGGLQEVREGKVIGGSMAPNFLGEHFSFQCESCDSDVVADFAQSKKRSALICPFCGASRTLSSCRENNSDRVKIEVGNQEIQRWDVVAFQVNDQAAGIKRVVGLPGETIQIRDGNLWLDGQLIQKSIREQKRTRILVHDSKKTSSENANWQAVDSAGARLEASKHRFANRKFNFDRESDNAKLQWFQFCNQRNYDHRTDSDSPPVAGEVQAWPIEDNYGYNQALTRNLNVVDEIFVAFKFSPVASRLIAWRFVDASNEYQFAVDIVRNELTISELSKSATDRATQRFKLAAELLGNSEIEVEFSTIDKLAVVLVGGAEVTRFEFKSELISASAEKRTERSNDNAQPLFQLGAVVVPGEEQDPIGRVRIWRDIYYLVAQEQRGQSQTLVGSPDGFLLLGDNQPVSIDSRHWTDVSVSKTDLIGKVRK